MARARQRRVAVKVSLLPMGRAYLALSGAEGVAREGVRTSAQTQAVGEGRSVMIKGDQERTRRRDLEVGGEERQVTW